MARPEDLHGKMEPEADQPSGDMLACATVSIAISLKRIADAVAGTPDSQGIALTLFYAGQAVERRAA